MPCLELFVQKLNKPPSLSEMSRRSGGWFAFFRRLAGLIKRHPLVLLNYKSICNHLFSWYDISNHKSTPGVNLIGHPYAILGRAEDVRTAALACSLGSIPMCLINRYGDYGSHMEVKHKDFPFFSKIVKKPNHTVNIFYLNADEMQSAWEHYGDLWFGGHFNIGCFAWELSHFPQEWYRSFENLQELWAPTEFIRQSLMSATQIPVVHMPFVIEPGTQGGLSRGDFSLPLDRFLFLFLFDFRSYVNRKNPQSVLEAFLQAFPVGSSAQVHLVIKVNGQQEKSEAYSAFLSDERLLDTRISIIEMELDDRGIKSLISICDVFVSLHRSEGFGRGLAEAMYYGKPVIGTAYSGNLDFMAPGNSCLVDYKLIPLREGDYPHWEGQKWADPDVTQAAYYMRKLASEPDYALNIGENARSHILTHHSSHAVGLLMRQRLEQLGIIAPL